MHDSSTDPRHVVWEVLAQFWVDTWYDADEIDGFASRLEQCGFSMRELDRIAYREVCGAFATFTLAVFLSAGMALPDWFFPEDLARKKVSGWLARPILLSLVNPFWVVGYCCARWFLRRSWPALRERVSARLARTAV
jgi:hypothetical protein